MRHDCTYAPADQLVENICVNRDSLDAGGIGKTCSLWSRWIWSAKSSDLVRESYSTSTLMASPNSPAKRYSSLASSAHDLASANSFALRKILHAISNMSGEAVRRSALMLYAVARPCIARASTSTIPWALATRTTLSNIAMALSTVPLSLFCSWLLSSSMQRPRPTSWRRCASSSSRETSTPKGLFRTIMVASSPLSEHEAVSSPCASQIASSSSMDLDNSSFRRSSTSVRSASKSLSLASSSHSVNNAATSAQLAPPWTGMPRELHSDTSSAKLSSPYGPSARASSIGSREVDLPSDKRSDA
mmetsp:Transcript_18001/g.51626  ORF Transcript_18001/g.51626 Transcript_18001/m.51626 type:complete len:303 (-) Transcript_18001:406-1314(-)